MSAMCSFLTGSEDEKWAVDYSAKINTEELSPFSVVVLDGKANSIINILREENKKIYGYISVSEVSNKKPYFQLANEKGLLLEENANELGNYTVDIRREEWAEFLIEKVIPQILNRRFDGLFIDTLDHSIALEELDPIKYKGMKVAAKNLILGIRHHFPSITLMVNRGYGVIEEIAEYIDILLGESVYTSYNFEEKEYYKQKKNDYDWQVSRMKAAKKVNPKLQLFTLDYWDPKDLETIKEIYRVENENGFSPYVSTIDLQEIIHEPK